MVEVKADGEPAGAINFFPSNTPEKRPLHGNCRAKVSLYR
ncbi:hypothetical protein A343_0541, partial [Porphyromonas gingivalis JCVI SC001]